MGCKIFRTFLIFMLICSGLHSQKYLHVEGYKFLKRIKGLGIGASTVNEIMIDEQNKFMVVSYRMGKAMYVRIYKMDTFEKVGEYRFLGRIELYSSYFAENYKAFYANYDIFKQYYARIDLRTGDIDSLTCTETPGGCEYTEAMYNKTSVFSNDRIYFAKRDNDYKDDVLLYMDRKEYITILESKEADYDTDQPTLENKNNKLKINLTEDDVMILITKKKLETEEAVIYYKE